MDQAISDVDRLLAADDFESAEAICTAILAREPDNALVLRRLSGAVLRRGRAGDAETYARRVVELGESDASNWSALGDVLSADLRWCEACEAYGRALALDSSDAATWNNLGAAATKLGRLDSAQQAIERALALSPRQPSVIANYACLLCRKGEEARATQWVLEAWKLDPARSETWCAVGDLWQAMGEADLAITAYRNALAISPETHSARYDLAQMLCAREKLSEAEDVIRSCVTTEPMAADRWSLFADLFAEILARQGRGSEGLPYLRRAAELVPRARRHSQLLLALQYDQRESPASLLAAHREWDAFYARHLGANLSVLRVSDGRKSRPLRLGIVSGDLVRGPTGFMVAPGLERLDPKRAQLVCYSDSIEEDDCTSRCRAAAHAWRRTARLSDEQLARQITADGIDVLIDLMGHAGGRLLVFAQKPARVQLTWFGYVGTTGMSAMDFLLADRFHVPEGEDQLYSESILRMPNDYACFGPPQYAPDVSPLPALRQPFTFACFNNPYKYSERVLDSWARILVGAQTARLLLKYRGLGDSRVQQGIRRRFEERGVEGDRLLFEGGSDAVGVLAAYDRADLALDTQPYSGGLTTCEALWMGVPTITLPGQTFAGRHTTSHMINAGYPDFVAQDFEGYVNLAVGWANRLDELAVIRSEMRERVRRSPLCDAERFAKDFVELIENAWRTKVTRE